MPSAAPQPPLCSLISPGGFLVKKPVIKNQNQKYLIRRGFSAYSMLHRSSGSRHIKGGSIKANYPASLTSRMCRTTGNGSVNRITCRALWWIRERGHWWKMQFYATRAVALQTAVRNSWSVLMKLLMNYCFEWQNMLLSLPTPRARSPDNVLRRTLSLHGVEQEWSAQAHWFSLGERLSLRRTIIIAQMRHLKVNIHLNKVLSGILLSCSHQAMTMGLQRSGQ